MSIDQVKHAVEEIPKPEIDWNDLGQVVKRAPQYVRSRLTGAERVSDPQFDELVSQIKGLDKQFDTLDSSLQKHRNSLSRLLKHSIAIGELMRSVADPSHAEGGVFTKQQSQLFKRASQYTEKHVALLPEIEEESKLFEERVREHLKKVSKQIKNAHRAIKERNYALLDYEKYNQEASRLAEKQDLSLKEHKRKFEVSKKLDDSRSKYELLNNKLKLELPVFMLIVRQVMSQLFVMIYFATLNIFYCLYNSCQSLSESFGFDLQQQLDDRELQQLRSVFETAQRPITDKIESLSLVHFHEISLNKLQLKVLETTAPSEICVALYDFEAAQANDLSFRQGDRIKILDRSNPGWWKGMSLSNGSIGLFPNNYVEIL